MEGMEKRRFNRLPITLDLSCRRVDSATEVLHEGRTINVGPGGIYFQTFSRVLEPGHLVKIDLSIPPTEGLLEFGGRISGLAKVLRTGCPIESSELITADDECHGVAAEFCQPLRVCT